MTPEEFVQALIDAIDDGLLQGLYRLASVRPEDVLVDLRRAGCQVPDLVAVRELAPDLLREPATRYVALAQRSAALSGASLGLGGWIGLPAGLLHLIVVVMRLAQRISLTYGFDHTTDRGEIELWKALAHSVGASMDWEGTEAELMRRLPAVVTGTGAFQNPLLLKAAQAVLLRLAATYGLRATRWVPVVGGGAGLAMNWVHVGRIGKRLREHYGKRHALVRFDPGVAIEVEILPG